MTFPTCYSLMKFVIESSDPIQSICNLPRRCFADVTMRGASIELRRLPTHVFYFNRLVVAKRRRTNGSHTLAYLCRGHMFTKPDHQSIML